MSLWSWVRALTEAKEKGMGHAPIACEWDHPSSEWARGWGPYNNSHFWLRRLRHTVEEEEANFGLLVLHLFKDLAWFK